MFGDKKLLIRVHTLEERMVNLEDKLDIKIGELENFYKETIKELYRLDANTDMKDLLIHDQKPNPLIDRDGNYNYQHFKRRKQGFKEEE